MHDIAVLILILGHLFALASGIYGLCAGDGASIAMGVTLTLGPLLALIGGVADAVSLSKDADERFSLHRGAMYCQRYPFEPLNPPTEGI